MLTTTDLQKIKNLFIQQDKRFDQKLDSRFAGQDNRLDQKLSSQTNELKEYIDETAQLIIQGVDKVLIAHSEGRVYQHESSAH